MTYYLLRNNRESGPYTWKELGEMPLLTTDLVWINGESTSWRSPSEIEELEGLAQTPQKTKKPEINPAAAPDKTKTTPDQLSGSPSTPGWQQTVAEEPIDQPSFEALRKKYELKNEGSRGRKNPVSIGANLMGVLILLIGISVSAFMLQKAVENIEQDTVTATAEAREIGESTSYINTSSQAAMAPWETDGTKAGINSTIAAEATIDRRQVEAVPSVPAPILTETAEKVTEPPVTVKKETTTTEKEPVQKPAAQKEKPVTEKTKQAAEKNTEEKEPAETDSTAAAAETEKDPSEEKETSKPKLRLSANEYKVGLLGGISNLELSVSNPSQRAISRAVVQVEYLKPNGKVVASQKVEVAGLAPNATKQIPVPDNGRGVSVRYRIVNVEMK